LKIVNKEGEEIEFGKAEYEVRDELALLAKLRSLEELHEESRGDSGTRGFAWIQPIGGSLRPLGSIEIGEGRLVLEAMSRTRLQTGRGLLESYAGPLLKHVGDSYTGMEEIKQKAMGGTSPVEKESRPPIPPELEREIVLKMKGDHYSQWVNDPLPALKGKTPRQAVKTAEGRKAVIDLLSTLENMEAREFRSGRPAYDVSILRRDLGLPEE
jgi:hypothetical protein